MKISHVDAITVNVPAADPAFSWRDGLPGSAGAHEGSVLRIGTDDGLVGVAAFLRPGAGPMLRDLVDRLLRRELVGQDPLRREYLWHRIWELDRIDELPLPALGLVDTALWDLAAREQGRPLWAVLGGFRQSIPAYASTSTFASTEEFLDVVDQCIQLGFRGIKLHAWGDARRDAALCAAVRERVGDGLPLMYDGSAGFDLPDAIYLGDALHDSGYLWYEEPMREFSVSAYRSLARSCRVPLLVAETSDGAHMNTADFIAAGAATFGVRIGATLRGGVTGSLRTAHLADAHRLRAEPHGSGLPERHLCMAVSNATYFESLVTSLTVVRDPGIGTDGMLRAPSAPGIGLPASLDYPAALAEFVDEGDSATIVGSEGPRHG